MGGMSKPKKKLSEVEKAMRNPKKTPLLAADKARRY